MNALLVSWPVSGIQIEEKARGRCEANLRLFFPPNFFSAPFPVATLETRRRLGRVNFRKDFWYGYQGRGTIDE